MASETKLRMGGPEWAMLAALALLWAGSYLLFKVLVSALPPFTVVFGRVTIAAAVLNLVVLMRGGRLPGDPAVWLAFAVMGLINNVVPFSLTVFGEERVPSGVASVLIATTPMFAVLVAQAFTRDEAFGAAKAIGLGFGFLGVVALVGPAAFDDLGHADAGSQAAVLGAALSYGCAAVYGRRFRALPPLTVACGQLSSSAALTLPLGVLVDRPWTLPMPGPGVWAALFGLALFSTALAYILFFTILARAGATAASLTTLVVPVGAVLLGWAFLGEALGASTLAGMTAIGFGLVCLDGRVFVRMRPAGSDGMGRR